MANGRCRLHGGATPRGDDWHKPRWPNGKATNGVERLNRKLRDRERAAKRKAERLAAMTPEERTRYYDWARARRPGPARLRAAARERREQDQEARALLSAPREEKPRNPELLALDAQVAAARVLIAELERRKAERDNTDDERGCFG